jgi:hypothetical protein
MLWRYGVCALRIWSWWGLWNIRASKVQCLLSGNKAMSKSKVQKPQFQSILKSSCGQGYNSIIDSGLDVLLPRGHVLPAMNMSSTNIVVYSILVSKDLRTCNVPDAWTGKKVAPDKTEWKNSCDRRSDDGSEHPSVNIWGRRSRLYIFNQLHLKEWTMRSQDKRK